MNLQLITFILKERKYKQPYNKRMNEKREFRSKINYGKNIRLRQSKLIKAYKDMF